ncbi:hypothetical protein BASA61_007267 [Batrachochytrium salamandrivorans]|nr:hypothetical protein BASA62_009716 [Batrachochytrium salamandrivorans]KAH6570889.1 hypothetical protein BASA60_007496 [Batrachochytrium salamandrivorans]KAH6584775.1 hypothetical protein BASA61_007267 [Batrachochytrium salamandrivorans]
MQWERSKTADTASSSIRIDGIDGVSSSGVSSGGLLRARTGLLGRQSGLQLQTPCVLSYTRQACIPHIVDPASTLSAPVTNGTQGTNGTNGTNGTTHGTNSTTPVALLNVAMEHFADLLDIQGKRHNSSNNDHISTLEHAPSAATAITTTNSNAPPHIHLGAMPPAYLMVATPHDLTRLATPNSRWISSSKTTIGIMCNGNIELKMSPQRYVDLINIVQPDMVVCLADPGQALYHTMISDSGPARKRRMHDRHSLEKDSTTTMDPQGAVVDASVESKKEDLKMNQLRKRSDRNLSYLSSVIQILAEDVVGPKAAAVSSSTSPPSEGAVLVAATEPQVSTMTIKQTEYTAANGQRKPRLLAHLCGENSLDERSYFSTQVAKHFESANAHVVGGVAISLPAPDVADLFSHSTTAYLTASLLPIPQHVPVIALGISRLTDLVAAVAAGVDVIDNQWVYDLTNQGKALIMSFRSRIVLESHGLPRPCSDNATTNMDLTSPHPVHSSKRDLSAVDGHSTAQSHHQPSHASTTPSSQTFNRHGDARGLHSTVEHSHANAVVLHLMPSTPMKSHGPRPQAQGHGAVAGAVAEAVAESAAGTAVAEAGSAAVVEATPPTTVVMDPTGLQSTPTTTTTTLLPTSPAAVVEISQWVSDSRPLSPQCGCWTCKRPHSRAYLHHLLCVNDMLAMVLLMHHNTYQLDMFVTQMRDSIADGTFYSLAEVFLRG